MGDTDDNEGDEDTKDEEREEAEEGDRLSPVQKVSSPLLPLFKGANTLIEGMHKNTINVMAVTSCSSVKRIKDSALKSFSLGFNQLEEPAWKDHDGCLHSLQLAEEPRVGRDEDILYEATLCLSGRCYVGNLR